MDTETGRVYLPEEFAARKAAMEQAIDLRQELDEHQAEFEERLAAGKIVEVSERVALQQLRGQEVEARKRRRKAQKAARKRGRA